MENGTATHIEQEAKEVDLLFTAAEDKAPGPRGKAETAATAALWFILIADYCFFMWRCIGEENAARAAGTADTRFLLLHETAQMGLMVLILTRLARRWMGYGNTVSRLRVRGCMIEMMPKWDEGAVFVSTGQVGNIVVTAPAFGTRAPRMTLTEKAGRRHTIRRLSDTSQLGALAAFCANAQIGFDRRKDSRAKETLYFGTLVALVLAFAATVDSAHPARTFLKLSGLALVALVLVWMRVRRR